VRGLRIVHLTDLHFGPRGSSAAGELARVVTGLQPGHVVVTGDITLAGRRSEFAAADAFLGQLPGQVVVIPGNHDVPVYAPVSRAFRPWRRFQRVTGALVNGVREDGHLRLIALNTARRAGLHWDWSRGRVSRRQLQWLGSCVRPDEGGLQAVALHHPVFRSESRAGNHLVGRRDALVDTLGQGRVDLLFSGHAHLSRVQLVDAGTWSLVAVQSGSALGDRLRGEPPSFTCVDYSHDTLTVCPWVLEGGVWVAGTGRVFHRADAGWDAVGDAPGPAPHAVARTGP
jgi:3',5'-cyclic AMP phosphodiesterase CpdA